MGETEPQSASLLKGTSRIHRAAERMEGTAGKGILGQDRRGLEGWSKEYHQKGTRIIVSSQLSCLSITFSI